MNNSSVFVLAAFFISFLITYVMIPVIIRVAELKHLFDEPDDRKQHKAKTPTLGGMAIFAGLILSFTIFKDVQSLTDVKYLVPALTILFFAGIKDDILVLTPMKKLLAQFMSAFLIVVLGHIKINSFYGLFGIQEIPYWFSIVFTVIAIVAIINCYNLIDGVDGLAGSLGLLSSTSFGLWFYLNGHWSLVYLSFALSGSLLGFLMFNWQPAKIFMGDTGAMLIGFILAVQSIHFIEFNKARSIVDEYWIHASPSVAIAVMAIPIFDMVRVFILRLAQKKSPFSADRNHLHHILIDLGFSHRQTVVILMFWSWLVILLAIIMRDAKSSFLLLLLISLVYLPSLGLQIYRNKKIKI